MHFACTANIEYKTNINHMIAQQKNQLRKMMRQKRKTLSHTMQGILGRQLKEQVKQNNLLHLQQHIACFLSFDHEILTQPLIEMIWALKKNCYLPQIHPKQALSFVLYNSQSCLQKNSYLIDEPINSPSIALNQLDLVFMPLVAFDKQGYRLGMGGGFYDTTFKRLYKKKHRPQLIGLAHDCQEVERLICDEWDIPLDAICTPTRWLRF
jgi:5-formyltetrahydrofolate cyclo-ligase